jgi:C-terminal processing protease CtpA/Prc
LPIKTADIITTLTGRYTRLWLTMRKFTPEEVLEVYLNALAHVYDPHSDYFGPAQRDDLSIAMNLSLFGVGATLRAEDGYAKVYELVPGAPAARSGLLKTGDRIVAVGQADQKPVDVVDMPLSDVRRVGLASRPLHQQPRGPATGLPPQLPDCHDAHPYRILSTMCCRPTSRWRRQTR